MSKKNLSLKRRMVMLKSLMVETGKYLKAGCKTRLIEEQEKVIVICEQCEFYDRNHKLLGPRCSECGCCMTIKKRWITAHCPKNKW